MEQVWHLLRISFKVRHLVEIEQDRGCKIGGNISSNKWMLCTAKYRKCIIKYTGLKGVSVGNAKFYL